MSQPNEAQGANLEAQLAVEQQLSFVMAHPGMSVWLKNALSSALDRNPVDVLNDLEILNLILRNRSQLRLAEQTADPIQPTQV